MKPSLLFLLVILLAAAPLRCRAADEKPPEPPLHWYSVEFQTGYKTMTMIGTSPLDEAAFAKSLEGTAFIRLENLVYFDQNQKPKDWTEWTKFNEPRVYINPKDIIEFFPLRDDPRKIAAAEK